MVTARRLPAFALFAVTAAMFAAVTALLRTPLVSRLDISVIGAVTRLESPAMTAILKTFTLIGSGAAVTVLSACVAMLLYRANGRKREIVLLFAVQAGSGILDYALKEIIKRARPDTNRLIEVAGHSFPSGHSMLAATFYGLLVYLLYRRVNSMGLRVVITAAGAFMIAVIGISRIYLGVHYPSDVLGGFIAGISWVFFCIWLYGFWTNPAPRTTESGQE